MRNFLSVFSPLASSSETTSPGLKNIFNPQSMQDPVRDDVAFAPARDPNEAFFIASRRFDAGRSLVTEPCSMLEKQDDPEAMPHERLLPAK